jgi:plastocyanin
MKNTIIAIVVIAVVIAGGFFLLKGAYQPTSSSIPQASTQKQPSQQPVSPAPAVKENVVTYTDSGYAPSTLTIKKGETVTFKNQSSRSMWTASAVHPTHRVYPTSGGCLGSTFDACAGIQPGGSWSFKFDIAGTWKYHNHLNPGDTGTIVVE